MSHVKDAEVLDLNNGPISQDNASQTPSPPRFPQEIFDHIIDHMDNELEGRLDGLRTCSLVSRDWASSTAYHLFYSLHWPLCCHSHHRIPAESELFKSQHCPHKIDGHGPDVLRTLLVEAPRVCNNIRDLRVEFPNVFPPMRPTPGVTSFQFRAVLTWTTLPDLLSLVNLLPQLRSLRLSNARVRECDSHQLDFLTTLRRTRSLTMLTIGAGDEHEPDHSSFDMASITRFLHLFTLIRTLRFSNLHKDRNGLYPQPLKLAADGSSTLAVQTLVFDRCYSDGLSNALSALQSVLDFSTLTSLELGATTVRRRGADPVLARALSAFLNLTLNLEVLTCRVVSVYPYLHRFVPPTIRQLHLHSDDVTMSGRIDTASVAGSQSAWPVISLIPTKLFTPSLHAIYVHLKVIYHPWSDPSGQPRPGSELLHTSFETELRAVLEGFDWAPFEDLAQRVEVCTLRMLFGQGVVYFPDEPAKRRCMDTMERIARECMPESIRGIVRVEVSEMSRKD